MAIYEYKCTNKNCNHLQTETRPMSDWDKDSKCEECGKKAERILSAPNVIVAEGNDFFTDKGKF